ncbi:MAG: hypothetical protein K6F68_03290 [Clostridiales bacterium]|nr:hypothetical protein [Clostridiales bacterium]
MNKGLIKDLLYKLRDNRKLEITVYAIAILFAVFIFLVTGGISCGKRKDTAILEMPSETPAAFSASEHDLEKRLEIILSEIDGAGNVSVMITFENEATGNASDDIETGIRPKTVKGVIVVAEGANDLKVKAALIEAVKTVLSIEPSKINVFHKR